MTEKEQNRDLLKAFEPVALDKLDDTTKKLVNSAKGIFVELSRLIKSMTLYGAEHQISIKFKSHFCEIVTQALTKGYDITLEVEAHAFVIADQIVFENPNVKDNFIYRFYKDGIRSLTFQRGVTNTEVEKLLKVFLLDWSDPLLFEDDPVTIMWEQKFRHIKYEVAVQYIEDIQETDKYLFSYTNELNRLSDYSITSKDSVKLTPLVLNISDEQDAQIKRFRQLSKRELIEKLIALSHETQSNQDKKVGFDRFVRLLKQLAQHFTQMGEIGELERLIFQAFLLSSNLQRSQLVNSWAVPVSVRSIMKPLRVSDDPLAPSSLSCLRLVGSIATPQIALYLGETAECYLDTLTKMISPYLKDHPIELSRVVKNASFVHNKRLIPILYESKDDALCLKTFQTGWIHHDQGVRYEVLLTLPERLYTKLELRRVFIKGLSDPFSKIRTLSIFRLSKVCDEYSRNALKEHIDEKSKSFEIVDLRKLYAALALMKEPSEFFITKWVKHNRVLKLSSIGSKGKEEGHSLLIGLALSQQSKEQESFLQQVIGKRFGATLLNEAATWGLAYLQAKTKEQEQMVYELFFRNLLTLPKGKHR
jgi:hypothetical protein